MNYTPAQERRALDRLLDDVNKHPAPAFPPQNSMAPLESHVQDGMTVHVTLRLLKSGVNAWLVAAPTTLPDPKIQYRAWLPWSRAQFLGNAIAAGFGHSTFSMRARTYRWLCTQLAPTAKEAGRDR